MEPQSHRDSEMYCTFEMPYHLRQRLRSNCARMLDSVSVPRSDWEQGAHKYRGHCSRVSRSLKCMQGDVMAGQSLPKYMVKSLTSRLKVGIGGIGLIPD